eukprot:59401-Rhodomonas_salina.5
MTLDSAAASRLARLCVPETGSEPRSACADATLRLQIVSCGEDGTVRMWDANEALQGSQVKQNTGRSLAWHPTANFVRSAGVEDEKWEAGHVGAVTRCLISPDCLRVISAGADKTVKVSRLHTCAPEFRAEFRACVNHDPDERGFRSGRQGVAMTAWCTV